jgi:hypothetical protein
MSIVFYYDIAMDDFDLEVRLNIFYNNLHLQ